jgi:hypothetical protein
MADLPGSGKACGGAAYAYSTGKQTRMIGAMHEGEDMNKAWIAAAALAAAGAQAQPAAPANCAGPEYRQFDFWIGHWDVYGPAGKKVGENIIEPFAGGCGLAEHWTGTGGVTGRSLNMYDASDRQWHQVWVDSSGSRLLLDGQFSDGKMVLGSDGPNPAKPGTTLRQQITWSVNPDASVRQLWRTSTDGGKTWTTAFDGKYIKRK